MDLIALYTVLVPRQVPEREPDTSWVCVGGGGGEFLHSSCIPSFSRIGEHFKFAYAPQMLSSLLEMSNSVEDQTLRMVALASGAHETIPPAEVLPECTGGVSVVRRSC